MILVGQMDSPFVRRVAVTLNLYAMPFEREIISVYGDADAVRKINPLGKVPALVLEDGETLFDSQMIIDYLDEQASEQSLSAEGFLATVLQHELDHLDGVLYIDRIEDPSKLAFLEEYARYHAEDD